MGMKALLASLMGAMPIGAGEGAAFAGFSRRYAPVPTPAMTRAAMVAMVAFAFNVTMVASRRDEGPQRCVAPANKRPTDGASPVRERPLASHVSQIHRAVRRLS